MYQIKINNNNHSNKWRSIQGDVSRHMNQHTAMVITTSRDTTNQQPACVGRVPGTLAAQDDTVFPQLTVEENLFWSANLRLPVEMSTDPARLSAIIEGAIQLLNLDRIQSSVVGDVKRRGISGGQKKRVNIGVELVSDPTVLFMDGEGAELEGLEAWWRGSGHEGFGARGPTSLPTLERRCSRFLV